MSGPDGLGGSHDDRLAPIPNSLPQHDAGVAVPPPEVVPDSGGGPWREERMHGFYAFPRRAGKLARNHHEIACLHRVYLEAETWTPLDEWNGQSEREWSEPFEARDTDLMVWGGWGSKRGARAWLDRFTRGGVVDVTRAGSPRTARMIRVTKPYHLANHLRNHVPDRNCLALVEDTDEDGPQVEPQPEPQPVKTRDQSTDTEPRHQTTDTPSTPTAWAPVWTTWLTYHPTARKPSARLRARVIDHGAEAVIRMLHWAHTSGAERAQWLQVKGYLTQPTLLSPDNCDTYVELSEGYELPPPPEPEAPYEPPTDW